MMTTHFNDELLCRPFHQHYRVLYTVYILAVGVKLWILLIFLEVLLFLPDFYYFANCLSFRCKIFIDFTLVLSAGEAKFA